MARLVKRYPLVVATRYNIPALLDKEGEGKVWICIGGNYSIMLLVYASSMIILAIDHINVSFLRVWKQA